MLVVFSPLFCHLFLATEGAQGAVTVSVTPAAITLNPLAVRSFSAAVSGATNSGVSWSLSPQVGTLTAAGNTAAYVAPATINSKQTVTITATSLADSTAHAAATILLAPLVSVSLNPGSAVILAAGHSNSRPPFSGLRTRP